MNIQAQAHEAFRESVLRPGSLDPAALLLCLSAELCRGTGFPRRLDHVDDILELTEREASYLLSVLPNYDLPEAPPLDASCLLT